MTPTLLQKIETVLDEHVRPALAEHQGNVHVLDVADSVLRVRLTGKCHGCPAAQLTTEEIIEAAITEHISEIKKVVLVSGVSDSLIAQAKQLLQTGHL